MDKPIAIPILVVLLCLIGFGPSVCVGLVTVQDIEATVDKVIIDNGKMYYAVTFADGTKEVLSNEDSVAPIKCDSNDINMDLEVGKTYKFKVNYFRSQPLSCYKNILEYEEVK